MARIKFGTDGWRGVIAEDFTFDNVRACAQSVADYLKHTGQAGRGTIIGYDTRFASEDFAAAAAEVIAANDIKVRLCQRPVPTPVISYAVTATSSAGAIIITASHNPGRWNGFKYKDNSGASAPPEVAARIEKVANEIAASGETKRLPLAEALKEGLVSYYDPDPTYFAHIASLVDIDAIRRSGLKIIVDSMYGAGAGYFFRLLGGGNISITEIHGERNPTFPGIQPEPIGRFLSELSDTVVKEKADVGLATDGDADRIGIIDENGGFLNQHQVFALLTLYLIEVRGERGAIIKTLTSTDMLYRLGEIYGVPVFETPVGFKYVAPLMKEKDAIIGGEESGGYGFRGHIPERDGILAGLYFLDFIIRAGKRPSQLLQYLFSKVGEHYYDRLDVHIRPEDRETLNSRISTQRVNSIAGKDVARLDTRDGYRYVLSDGSWLLVRFSGTEPLIRIYAEAHTPEQVQKLLDSGKKLLGL
jgi:alpha-D-glucose phosphate-specific phosphoglucomutase